MKRFKKLRKKINKQKLKENLYNLPNALTLIRVILTFVIIYIVFFKFNLILIAALFLIGMLTDTADGQIARRWNLKTEFGRKFDMIADRFLIIATISSLIIYKFISGTIETSQIYQIVLIVPREIIGIPFWFIGLIKGTAHPHVTITAKTTTVLQAITLPIILLGPQISWYIVIPTFIFGLASGIRYASDTIRKNQKFPKESRWF